MSSEKSEDTKELKKEIDQISKNLETQKLSVTSSPDAKNVSKDDDDKEENEGLILTIPPVFKSYVLKYRNTFWTNLINLI